jgi:hypothetical protein
MPAQTRGDGIRGSDRREPEHERESLDRPDLEREEDTQHRAKRRARRYAEDIGRDERVAEQALIRRPGFAVSTTSTFAVLPRPVRRPSVGRSAYFAGTNGRSSGRNGVVQPSSFSGASANTSIDAGGPAA